MGDCFTCGATDGDIQNSTIAKQLEKDKRSSNGVKKILFLGSGGSGKSTIFKQLRGIYGRGFNHAERSVFISHIHEQVVREMKAALEILEEYRNGELDGMHILRQNESKYIELKQDVDEEDEIDPESVELSESGKEAEAFLSNLHYTKYRLNDDIVSAIKCLWAEPAIQRMYDMRNITKIVDSSAYFWDKLDELNTIGYVPDEADILLVRYRTSGTTEEKYEMPDGKGTFSIIDVGGQKSERKKWINCFNQVTAVIFVASLSCYDEVLYEDYSTNSMTDQLELFDKICNTEALSETSMILFLNKKDLFADKILNVPLTKCLSFSDYTGSVTSFDNSIKHIRKAFTSLNNMPNRKNIFTHITCATDQDNIQKVFADVQHIVIEASLIQAGLMDWDDNQRYKSLDSKNKSDVDENEEYNDPATAKCIRESIQSSNRQKQQSYYSYSQASMSTKYTMSSGAKYSMVNTYNFREIIKKKSYPQLDSMGFDEILMSYQYNVDKNCVRFSDEHGILNGKYCWGQSLIPNVKQKQSETFLILDIEPNIAVMKEMSRKNVNLCVVLDVGRAMNNSFDDGKKKIDAVKEMIVDIIQNVLVNEEDRFSLITFGMNVKVMNGLCFVNQNQFNKSNLISLIRNDIFCEVNTLESQRVDFSGYQNAVSQFRKLSAGFNNKNNICTENFENRILFVTTTRLSQQVLGECAGCVKDGVYSTFIGVSNVFSLQQTALAGINGCNYFNINSSEQVREKILLHFEEIITPVIFDLNVTLKHNGNRCVENIYKLNLQQENEAQCLTKTMFLQKERYDIDVDDDDRLYRNVNNRYLLLVKLLNSNNYNFELFLTYKSAYDGTDEKIKNKISVSLQRSVNSDEEEEENKDDANELLNGYNNKEDYYDNSSMRKAIVLFRYIRVLREWIKKQKNGMKQASYVSVEFQNKFQKFHKYFKNEAAFINDDKSLNQEINVLSGLLK